jgi:D-alanine-D-alanine ligase
MMNQTTERKHAKERKHICVLMGGWSAEREVSLSTGKGVTDALRTKGYEVSTIDVDQNPSIFLEQIANLPARPDVFFMALHGKGVEDGTFQGLLNLIGIPYTHSGVLGSSLAMNKVIAKEVFRGQNILTPPTLVAKPEDVRKTHLLPPPYIVKPITEGSSFGVTLVQEGETPPQLDGWTYGDALLEPFIPGREICVAVIDKTTPNAKNTDVQLGTIEIISKTNTGFFDFDAKYADGCAVHVAPAELSEEETKRVSEAALKAHQALGCRSVTRSDFRRDEKGQFWLLEVNTIPGMTPISLVPDAMARQGISYTDLVEFLVESAQCDAV